MTIEELKEIVKDATKQAFDGQRISPDEKGTMWSIIAGERLWFRTLLDSVEAEPTKKGRWEQIVHPWYECSECGERTAVVNLNGEVVWNFCPNCGARMDEVSNDRNIG